MKKYAKIINEETKEVSVGLGDNVEFYKSLGMTEQDVEQSFNGSWYLKGYASKNIDALKENVRRIRDSYLAKYDFTQLIDAPFTDDEKEKFKEYRQYLRDYTKEENWWNKTPDDWATWLLVHYPVTQ